MNNENHKENKLIEIMDILGLSPTAQAETLDDYRRLAASPARRLPPSDYDDIYVAAEWDAFLNEI